MYEADIELSIFVVTGSNRIYPLCVVSPYILTVGLEVPKEPEIIILPDKVVFPSKVLFPTCNVEPVIFNEPVNSTVCRNGLTYEAVVEKDADVAIIPVNSLPSPRNDPENDPDIEYEPVGN